MRIYIGSAMIAAAFILRYIVGRRLYNRRHKPVQKVPSYNLQLWRRIKDEGTVFFCYFLIIVGVIIIISWFGRMPGDKW